MKKARWWLDSAGIDYRFHNYKTDGIALDTLRGWVDRLGWEVLLNRAGTTFRKLPEADKQGIDAEKAIALMVAQPSMIRRPVLERDGDLIVGFSADRYAAAGL